MSRTIRFGVPVEDAHLLREGFGRPDRHKETPCRPLAQAFRFLSPLPPKKENRLTLRMAAPVEQKVRVRLGGTDLGEQPLSGDYEWRELTFAVPAGAAAAGAFIEAALSHPHPLNSFAPRCALLGALTAESLAELPRPAFETPDAASTEEYDIRFGDVHVHSRHSCDARDTGGTISEICRNAAEDGSDLIAVADHDARLDEKEWRDSQAELASFDKPGRFATLYSYEWTSFFFGQINVYSPSAELPFLRATDLAADTPPKLWRALSEWGGPFFTAYHHPTRPGMCVNWDVFDERFMPVAEIYSRWGNSEYHGAPNQRLGLCIPGTTLQDALDRGRKPGFISGGDIHHGCFVPGAFGTTAVLVKELSREAVFNAIRNRLCYATTGARIKLDFKVNGFRMGRTISFNPYTQDTLFPLKFEYRVEGTAPLSKIEIVTDGGVVVYRKTADELKFSSTAAGSFELPNAARGAPRGASLSCPRRWFYLRVTQVGTQKLAADAVLHVDRPTVETAWSSPVFMEPDLSVLLGDADA